MLNKKKQIYLLLVIIILVAGAIMLFTKGINYDLNYGAHTTIELYLETEFESQDVQNIIKEVFGNDIETRQVNNLEKDILIVTKSATEEQLNNLVTKINEKYGLELTTDDLLVTNNAKINGIDLIKPYILPVCLSTIIALIYFIIRYRTLGIYKVSLITVLTVLVTQLLIISIYAISRLSVNKYTMPISMIIYIITLIAVTEKFENDLKRLKEKQK